MKYRHKLTILLVTASLVPMILLVLYSHDRMSSLLREKEMEDMSSILEQTGEGIDSQIEVFSSLGILIYFGNMFQTNTFFLLFHNLFLRFDFSADSEEFHQRVHDQHCTVGNDDQYGCISAGNTVVSFFCLLVDLTGDQQEVRSY